MLPKQQQLPKSTASTPPTASTNTSTTSIAGHSIPNKQHRIQARDISASLPAQLERSLQRFAQNGVDNSNTPKDHAARTYTCIWHKTYPLQAAISLRECVQQPEDSIPSSPGRLHKGDLLCLLHVPLRSRTRNNAELFEWQRARRGVMKQTAPPKKAHVHQSLLTLSCASGSVRRKPYVLSRFRC